MAALLQPVLEKLGTPVHDTLFPYAWGPTLHAARISLAYQGLCRRYVGEQAKARAEAQAKARAEAQAKARAEAQVKVKEGGKGGDEKQVNGNENEKKAGEKGEWGGETRGEMNWATYLAGYLVMAWGGTLLSHTLLSLHAPPLLSLAPWINYLSVHIFLTLLFEYTGLPSLPKGMGGIGGIGLGALGGMGLDAALIPLDALLRGNAVVGTVALLHSNALAASSSSSAASSAASASTAAAASLAAASFSPVFHAILGASASAGGGVLATSLRTYTPHWGLHTPTFLVGAGASRSVLISAADVWAGALVGVLAGVMNGRVDFGDGVLAQAVNGVISSFGGQGKEGGVVIGAKAAATYVYAGVFAWKVWMLQKK
ncbi:hypothetical protein CYLTODRAFT_271379 [Cylindrobasidium torrendii FP15055 ss-10]|uniref:Uncharacterized protein n=1 Tax=Cylindrobasidium torrendii FP15055 ss-10 TaxID=1314674 RepID=A0A0D7BS59_9AGAR|nr:hypothetical protein CYLTODRAFT_271379 [Cylindrobasidium torrendii FP15055 ss-10]